MLPAAQMVRFFICLSLGYPNEEEEMEILRNLGTRIPFETVGAVADPQTLLDLRAEIAGVEVSESCSRYIVELVQKTRSQPLIRQDASPRASRSLYQGGKTYAAMQGRDYVRPEDIRRLWEPVMSHRIVLTSDARFQKKTEAEILAEILEETEAPPRKKELFHGN